MSENCNQNCSSCGMDCGDRTEETNDFSVKLHEFSKVKKSSASLAARAVWVNLW